MWQWRQFLESLTHDDSCFCTLTYDDDHIPAGGALCKKDLQLFLKRLRFAVEPIRLRYFAVGEYGEETKRPHFHLSLFGMSRSQILDGLHGTYLSDDIVKNCWGKGFTYLGEFNEATALYVSRYVVKHLKDRKSKTIFDVPEFATMSRKPGLGAAAMAIIAETLNKTVSTWESGDVVHELKIGKRSIPLGRYLIRTLRNRVGFTEEYVSQIKEEATFQRSLDMLALFSDTSDALTVTEAFKKDTAQKIAQIESRYNIWLSKRSL